MNTNHESNERVKAFTEAANSIWSAPSLCSALDGAFVARFIAGEATPNERKKAWQSHEKEYDKLAENLSQEVCLKYLSEVDEYKDLAKSLKETFDLIATLPKKSNSVPLEELGLQV